MQAVFIISEGITMIECTCGQQGLWCLRFQTVFVKIRHSCLARKKSCTTIYCQRIINELFVFSMTFVPSSTHRSRVYHISIYGFSQQYCIQKSMCMTSAKMYQAECAHNKNGVCIKTKKKDCRSKVYSDCMHLLWDNNNAILNW